MRNSVSSRPAHAAARIVFDEYVTPSKELVSRLKCLPLDSRIAHSKAVLVYKSLHDFVSAYYMRILCTYQSNSLYSLRSETQGNLMTPKARTEFCNVYHIVELRFEMRFPCQLDSPAL